MSESKLVFGGLILLTLAGLLVPFWPLAVLGIVLGAILGRFVFALCAGLLVDLLWGAPPGMFEVLMVPMTLLALVALAARLLGKRYFFPKSSLRGLY